MLSSAPPPFRARKVTLERIVAAERGLEACAQRAGQWGSTLVMLVRARRDAC